MSKEPNRNVYVGQRYVPKIFEEWDKTISYEGLSIVTHKGGSYTSKKRVPVGIDILDNEFWALTGNYNAQIENYRQEVRDMEDRVTNNLSLVKEEMEENSSFIDHDSLYAGYYGVVADGSTDNTQSLENALINSQGKELNLPSGKIKITKPLSMDIEDDIIINGKNTEIIINASDLAEGSNHSILRFNNPSKTNKLVTSQVLKGGNVIQVNSSEGLNIGDGISIQSDEVYAARMGYNYNYFKGFSTKIVKIDGLNVTLKDPVPYDFNAGYNLRVNVYKPLNVSIRDLKVTIVGVNSRTSTIFMNGIFGGVLENATGENATVSHIYLTSCYGLNIKDIDILANYNDNISLNYGIYIQNSSNITIDGVTVNTLRHCITLTGQPPSNIVVNNCILTSYEGFSIDSHSSESIRVYNSILHDGMQIGLGSTKVVNTEILGGRGQSLIVVRTDVSHFLKNTEFVNCDFYHKGTPHQDSILAIYDGSYLEYIEKIAFVDCSFDHASGSLDNLIRLDQSTIYENIGDIVIDNCDFNCDVINLLVVREQVLSEGIAGDVNKRDLIIKENNFKLGTFVFTSQLKLFKNIIFDNNKALNGELFIELRGTVGHGVNAGKSFITNNMIAYGDIVVLSYSNDVVISDNTIMESSNRESLLSVSFGKRMVLLRNLFGDKSYEVHNAVVGWNRRIDGVNPYLSFGGSNIHLESTPETPA